MVEKFKPLLVPVGILITIMGVGVGMWWTMHQDVAEIKLDVATIKARLPREFPPERFDERVRRMETDHAALHRELSVLQNRVDRLDPH